MSLMLRWWHTLRHVRFRQLRARALLTLRRRWHVERAHHYRALQTRASLPRLVLRSDPSLPLLPPRVELGQCCDGIYTLTFLNESRQFTHPFAWHPPELEFGTRLWLLNLHYMEFLEALPDEAFVAVIDDWIENNPPFRPGYWLDDWNSYALSIRCVVWMQQFARRRQHLQPSFQDRMLPSLVRQLRFLARNLEIDIGGNHLIKNIKALLWAHRFFEFEEASAWGELGKDLLRQELAEQILGDGMHYERSPAYHAQVFADLLECYQVLSPGTLKDVLHGKLHQMAQVLVDLMHPDGRVSLFNDGGLHMGYQPTACLDLWRRLSGDHVHPRREVVLRDAGYFGMHSGDELVLVDCGQVAPDFLTAHGHGDILSFEWSIAGMRMIVDAGVYEYNPGLRRSYSRSTRAHNTVTLDGIDQCEFWGAFRMARRARVKDLQWSFGEDELTLQASHDGYRRLPGSPVHQRSFHIRPGSIHIIDTLTGGDGQLAEANLLLHPECSVEEISGGLVIRRGEVAVRMESEHEIYSEQAWWYPDFGVERVAMRVVLRYGATPGFGTFTLDRVE